MNLEELILDRTKYVGSGIVKSISASQLTTEPLAWWLKYKHGNINDTKIGQNTIGSI